MKVFLLLFRKSRGLVLLTVVFGLISGLTGVAQVILIGRALNHLAGTAIAVAFVVNLAILAGARFLSRLAATKLSTSTTVELRQRLCKQILATPLATLERVGTPVLQSILTEDVNAIVAAVGCIPEMLISATVAVGCLVYLGWLSPIVLGEVLLCIVVGVGVHSLATRNAVSLLRRARDERDLLFGHFRALVNGIKDLQLSRPRQQSFGDAVASTLNQLAIQEVAIVRSLALVHQAALLALYAIIWLILMWPPASLGDAARTSSIMTILMLVAPVGLLTDSAQVVTRGTIAIQKIESNRLQLADGEVAAVPMVRTWRSIALKGVTHRSFSERDDHSFVLGPIDARFVSGELVFLVGGNGSGKTTLAKVITGLYTPETGGIELDGRSIRGADVDGYRQLFSAVWSDSHLFERLVGREAGDAEQLDERARGLIAKLELDMKVKVEHGTFSTVSLSSGQRKRLALVQAYLDDRPFYVFDEWAADQDPAFKDVFYRTLLPEMKARGKTVLAITHDDRYFDLADRILHLESGRLITNTAEASSIAG